MSRLTESKDVLTRNIYTFVGILLFGALIYFNYDVFAGWAGEEQIAALKIMTQLCMLIAMVAVAIQIWFTSKFARVNKNIHMGALFLTISLLQFVNVMTYPGMPYEAFRPIGSFFDVVTHCMLPLGMVVIFSIRYREVQPAYRLSIFNASIVFWTIFIGVFMVQKDLLMEIASTYKMPLQYAAIVIQVLMLILLVRFLKLSRHKNVLLLMAGLTFLIGNVLYTLANMTRGSVYLIGELLQVYAYITFFRAIYYSSVEKPFLDLEQSELRMQRMAYYDADSGLPNYRYLEKNAIHPSTPVAVMLLEIRRMDTMKATFGQGTADQLVNSIIKKWKALLEDDQLFIRFSHHQFIICVQNYSDSKLEAVMDRLLATTSQPIHLKHASFKWEFTAGVALYPADGDSLNRIMKRVHLAHNEAKQTNAAFVLYDESMEVKNRECLRLEYELERGIANGEFFLQYQPQLDIGSRTIPSVEALVRWQHPTDGFVPPNRFIELAEKTELIIPLGMYVLRKACLEIKRWQEVHNMPLKVAVNVSLTQLYAENFAQEVQAVLRETKLSPEYLQLELTESVTSESEQIIPILQELKALGITLAIDDFGTGYSSLSYLADLPIDCVKVDRSFVEKIGVSEKGEAIIATILTLAQSLHLHVVAEGIETLEQLKYLEQVGCDKIQGYYISKPLMYEHLLEKYDELLHGLYAII